LGISLIGILFSGQNQKIPSDPNSPCQKTHGYEISANLENFLKIRIFTLMRVKKDQGVKNSNFQKFAKLAEISYPWVFRHGEFESERIF
jgi:hypothetical protein